MWLIIVAVILILLWYRSRKMNQAEYEDDEGEIIEVQKTPKRKGCGCLTVIGVFVILAIISSVFNKNDSEDPTTNPPSRQDNVSETSPRQESRTDYISSCGTVDYNSVERNPSNFNGKRIAITGKVIQVSEGWFDSVTLRVDCNGDVWYVKYTHKDNESRILEDDIITCYGECTGVESYTTILGSSVTIPSMKMQYFDLLEGNMTHPIETVILETKTPETISLDKTHTIYNQDDITIFPILTGIGNEKIGEYSVLRAKSSEVNEDYLTDWYVNHVKKNDYNYCVIVYSDQTSLVGVYATATHILKDCSFWIDDRGDYCLGDSSNATIYFLNESGYLYTLE